MTLDNHPLVGTWCSQEETFSAVEYSVKQTPNGFLVTATDSYDGEQGEIQSINWDEENQNLSFTCYWASSGRYSKCKFHRFAQDKVEFTYTYTDHEILVRKSA